MIAIMWNDDKSQRFDRLRRDEALRPLNEVEQAELEALSAELDAEEARALQPAIERLGREADELRARKAQLDAQARGLEGVVAQQERLLAEARAYAERLRLRRTALTDEFRRLKAS
jgi:hypothetical protein